MSRAEGRWQEARDFSERGLAVSSVDPLLVSTRVQLECEVGDFPQSKSFLERCLEVMRLGVPGPTTAYGIAAAVILICTQITGEVAQAEFAKTAAETVFSSPAATPLVAVTARAGLALTAVQRGDAAEAEEQYRALASAPGMMVPGNLVSTDRLLGLLALTMRNFDQAAEHFEDALAFCRRAGFKPENAWSAYDFANTLVRSTAARPIRARLDVWGKAGSLLEESLAIASELGMTPLMDRVIALQEQVGYHQSDAPEYPDGMTGREAEVLCLIAIGKSNRDIAEELVLSVRTVERHITNLYAKIGARGRADATTYVLSHNLLNNP